MFKPQSLTSGLAASTLQLPPGDWATVLDCLSAQFKGIDREQWIDRIARGRVLDAQGAPITPDTIYRMGVRIYYYREVAAERPIPFCESILHADDHLVVADKPHFLPVTPSGAFVEETLLRRLIRRLNNPDLVPLHRIDRVTAGLVLFSVNPASRARYQSLFRDRQIQKCYHALAAPLPNLSFPLTRKMRLAASETFFLMEEIEGPPNAETRIEVLDNSGHYWRYALFPVTGKKHQLRVLMAALGAPILNDDYYPTLQLRAEDDPQRPLKLLAKSLAFADPMDGRARHFESRLGL